jgi:hypothetical protein
MDVPGGYQASHRIPQQLATSDFYQEISQARDANGRQIFDIQNAWNNGQPLPGNNDGRSSAFTHEYIDASQHRGSHPRITDAVRNIFDAWDTQLRAAINGASSSAQADEFRATYARKAQDLADVIGILSVGGAVDPSHPELRLVYNRTDPNARVLFDAAAQAEFGVGWDSLTGDQKDVLINRNIDGLLGRFITDGELTGTGAQRLAAARSLTGDAIALLKPRHVALLDDRCSISLTFQMVPITPPPLWSG